MADLLKWQLKPKSHLNSRLVPENREGTANSLLPPSVLSLGTQSRPPRNQDQTDENSPCSPLPMWSQVVLMPPPLHTPSFCSLYHCTQPDSTWRVFFCEFIFTYRLKKNLKPKKTSIPNKESRKILPPYLCRNVNFFLVSEKDIMSISGYLSVPWRG